MCLDLVLYRKRVSSLQLLAWCTANFFFFFSNEKNEPMHIRYMKLLIPELRKEMLQDTWNMSSYVSHGKIFTAKDLFKNPASVEMNFQVSSWKFYLNSSCLFYTTLDEVDRSTNSAVIS